MSDMLVRLYDLPKNDVEVPDGVEVRRALSLERQLVRHWVAQTFNTGWASECAISFSRVPIACFIATSDDAIVGFCCYDSTSRGVAGPLGVAEAHRGRNVGSMLIRETLAEMKANGYAYAILGWVGPEKFFERVVGATIIEGSEPGLYRGLLPGT
jgi:ribosomal protein S18 acetylase RimI-like enzyme